MITHVLVAEGPVNLDERRLVITHDWSVQLVANPVLLAASDFNYLVPFFVNQQFRLVGRLPTATRIDDGLVKTDPPSVR